VLEVLEDISVVLELGEVVVVKIVSEVYVLVIDMVTRDAVSLPVLEETLSWVFVPVMADVVVTNDLDVSFVSELELRVLSVNLEELCVS
jgi:hypothetical protein